MSAGASELLLVSKMGAIYDADALLNSNPRGIATVNTMWLPEKPGF